LSQFPVLGEFPAIEQDSGIQVVFRRLSVERNRAESQRITRWPQCTEQSNAEERAAQSADTEISRGTP